MSANDPGGGGDGVVPTTLREFGSDLQTVWFWPVALGLATVALVLLLAFAWYALLLDRRADLPYAPDAAPCPDGWRLRKDGACQCQGGVNRGTLAADAVLDASALTDVHARRAWARESRVRWDGVTTD